MPRYLYQYVQLFSFMGAGTPEDPGGDFEMSCWIDAPDPHTALEWGFVLLGDYSRARYAHSADGWRHDGRPIREGEIVDDTEMLAVAANWDIPTCRIGETPEWHEPWCVSNDRRH